MSRTTRTAKTIPTHVPAPVATPRRLTLDNVLERLVMTLAEARAAATEAASNA